MKPAYVYILASRRHGTLYIGVTSDLAKRMYEHRENRLPGFTCEHDVKRLVHVAEFSNIENAIAYEKRIKRWNRDWKINLIERDNPTWDDLAVSMLGFDPLAAEPIPFRHPGEGRDPRTRNW